MTDVDTLNAQQLPAEESRVVEMLMHEVFPRMRQAWGVKCCLPASRAVVEGLRAAGLTANPLPVQLIAHPANLTRRIREEGRPPADDAESDEWKGDQASHGILFDNADAYRELGWTEADLETSWMGGHCVVLLLSRTGDRFLLDPSLPQMNHPEHGIVLPEPAIAPVTAEFASGEDPAVAVTPTDVTLTYRAHPEHQSYLETKGYMAPEHDPFDPISSLIFHFKRRALEVVANGDATAA